MDSILTWYILYRPWGLRVSCLRECFSCTCSSSQDYAWLECLHRLRKMLSQLREWSVDGKITLLGKELTFAKCVLFENVLFETTHQMFVCLVCRLRARSISRFIFLLLCVWVSVSSKSTEEWMSEKIISSFLPSPNFMNIHPQIFYTANVLTYWQSYLHTNQTHGYMILTVSVNGIQCWRIYCRAHKLRHERVLAPGPNDPRTKTLSRNPNTSRTFDGASTELLWSRGFRRNLKDRLGPWNTHRLLAF